MPRERPDLILLDVDLGTERAIDYLYATRQAGIRSKVLVVTAGISDAEAGGFDSLREWRGSSTNTAGTEELYAAIRKIADGDVYLEQRYLKGLFENLDRASASSSQELAERELMVIRALLQGLANKEIGQRVGLSESSVKAILRGLFG